MSTDELHLDIEEMFSDDMGLTPLDSLQACGRLKEVMREREVHLVRQCRREGATWEQVGDALGYDAELMEMLWGTKS